MYDSVPVERFHHLLHPCVTALVTSCDSAGVPNIAAIAWIVPLSVRPPLVGFALRPSRHSYRFIRETKEFVVNVAPYEVASEALLCGRRSGKDVDKFAVTGLTPGKAQRVRPPIVVECVSHLECKVVQDVETGDHRFLVGEVVAAYVRPGMALADGLYDLVRFQPLLHVGRDRFTTTVEEYIEPMLSP